MNFMKTLVAASVAGAMMVGAVCAQEDSLRPREYGIQFGVLQPGQNNAITDVEGVLVGQVNVHDDKKGAHTGVTAILPFRTAATSSRKRFLRASSSRTASAR